MSSASAQSANVQSAIAFLRDPSVADSPFAKKVAFLESKGLSQLDIDTAVRLAASHDTATPATTSFSSSVSQQQQQQQHQYNPSWRQQQQQQPARYPGAGGAGPNDWRTARPDWRDWFIMAVVTGSVGTVAYSLARKYLFPALQPPSATALAEAQAALEAKYDEASGILASLQDETSAIRETLQSQEESVRESTRAVDSAVKKLGEREEERDRQIGEIKTEMDAIKGLMERMFEKHKDAQSTSLSAIQDEVKSLKSLLARRAEAASASAPAPAATSATASGASGAPAPSSSSASASGSGTNPTAAPFVSSSSPSQSAPQVGAPTPYTGYTSPYAAGGRFGLAGGASASASTSVPGAGSPYASGRQSPNFAAIANRPPGIPAWQQQQQQAAQARAAVPAPMPVAASAEDGDAVKGGPSATVQKSTSPEATSVQEQGSGADLAESGEIVDSSEITA